MDGPHAGLVRYARPLASHRRQVIAIGPLGPERYVEGETEPGIWCRVKEEPGDVPLGYRQPEPATMHDPRDKLRAVTRQFLAVLHEIGGTDEGSAGYGSAHLTLAACHVEDAEARVLRHLGRL